MKSYIRILACASALAPISAHAQFGGVVFDPTQSVHAAQQILQSSQLYTTTVDATRNVISAYNLAQRMATAPQQLYGFLQPWPPELDCTHASGNTYGNTGTWMGAVSSGNGALAGTQ